MIDVIRKIIRFPVITFVSIQGYQLYPGESNRGGLEYETKPGVNIVVGINGLGKTTYLNLLLRLLAGPVEIRTWAGLGMGGRASSSSDRNYFSARVKDGAGRAYATATIGFGDSRLVITRKLSDLSLTRLSIDGISEEGLPSVEFENRFRQVILRLSGLQQFYDYLLLLQFVFFSLENRQVLIWDENAQSEVLRVLYYDPTSHINYTKLYNSIVQLDSEYRNTLSVVNRQKKRLQDELAKQANRQTQNELKTLKQALNEIMESIEQGEIEEERLSESRIALREKLEATKAEIEQKRAILRQKREKYLASKFSKAESEALYALASSIGSRGCILCGSKSEELQIKVLEKVEKHICPLCSAEQPEWEYVENPPSVDSQIAEMESLELANKELEYSICLIEDQLTSVQQQYQDSLQKLSIHRRQAQEIRIQIAAIEQSLPSGDGGVEKIKEKLVGFQEALDTLRQEKEEAEIALNDLVSAGERVVAQVAHKIAERFSYYIKGFMAEECTLQYTVKEKSIGQGASTTKFRFPLFSVKITSGVFRESATNRYEPSDVSESQREFIDLAFRMSLIAEITASCPAMLVIETPEASLDSVFVPRAGNMINQFLHGGKTPNYLIASTNLNREAMIPALFNVISEYEAQILKEKNDREAFVERTKDSIPACERESRIINLLRIAASNAALGNYKDEYEDVYQNAVFPCWESFDNVVTRN